MPAPKLKRVYVNPASKRAFIREWQAADRSMGMHWDKKIYYFELYDGKELAGYSYITTNGGVGELKEILVKKKFRNKGYGELLLKHFVGLCKRRGCHKLILTTSKNHKAARKLYEKMGFRVENEWPNYRYHSTWYLYSRRIK